MTRPIDPRLLPPDVLQPLGPAKSRQARTDTRATGESDWQGQWRRALAEQVPAGQPAPRLGEPALPPVRLAPVGAMSEAAQPQAIVAHASDALTRAHRSGLRLHAQWLADGLHLWIGADSDALDQVPDFVRATLEQCRRAGQRVARIVCNGRVLHAGAPRADSQASNGDC